MMTDEFPLQVRAQQAVESARGIWHLVLRIFEIEATCFCRLVW